MTHLIALPCTRDSSVVSGARPTPSRARSLRSVASLSLLASFAASAPAFAQDELWTVQHGSPSTDRAFAATPAGAGGVFVVGNTAGSLAAPLAGGSDAWLARFDAAGTLGWMCQLGTGQDDSTLGCAPDAAGGVYAVGTTFGSLAGPLQGPADGWIARYDGLGVQHWIRQFGTGADESAVAAASDGSGGAFIAGRSKVSSGGGGGDVFDVLLARYDSAGNQLWLHTFVTPVNDWLYGAAPDGAGGVFLAGSFLGGPSAGGWDAWIARFDGAGNQLWIEMLGTNSTDGATAICSDGAGGLLVGGATAGDLAGQNSGTGSDAWVARYDGNGDQDWILQFGSIASDALTFCAQDGSGGCFVGGDNGLPSGVWMSRIDGEGDLLWTEQLGTSPMESAYAAASDGAGGNFLLGQGAANAGAPDDIFLTRYDGECQAGENYCTALVSSGDCLPSMDSSGVPSLANPTAFLVRAESLEPNKVGLVIFGTTGAASIPFMGGTLCIEPPIYRDLGGPTTGSAPCSGKHIVSLAGMLGSSGGTVSLTPGTEVHCQGWFRDPMAPQAAGLTDGLKFTVCP